MEIRWFSSYLESRSQRGIIEDTISDSMELKYGLPQGSCAGPLLYTMYVSTLREVFKFDLSVMGYVYDHAVYSSLSVDNGKVLPRIINIEACLEDLKMWMVRNRLMMNEDKAGCVDFGSSHSLANQSVESIHVENEAVEYSSAVKYLGSWLDSTLNMKRFISDRCRIASFKVYNIRKIKKYLCRQSLEILFNALLILHLDYCNDYYLAYQNHQPIHITTPL